VSAYGHPHNGTDPSNMTRNNRSNQTPRTAYSNGACRQTVHEEILCSNIHDNTGEFVANYINNNSVSTRIFLFNLFIWGKVKNWAILFYFKSDVDSTDKMADINKINFPSFAPS
jgi:hypothetical protein